MLAATTHLLVDLGGKSGVKKTSPPGSLAKGDDAPSTSGDWASAEPLRPVLSSAAEAALAMLLSCTLKGLALEVCMWVGVLAACCRFVVAAGARLWAGIPPPATQLFYV